MTGHPEREHVYSRCQGRGKAGSDGHVSSAVGVNGGVWNLAQYPRCRHSGRVWMADAGDHESLVGQKAQRLADCGSLQWDSAADGRDWCRCAGIGSGIYTAVGEDIVAEEAEDGGDAVEEIAVGVAAAVDTGNDAEDMKGVEVVAAVGRRGSW